MPVMLIECCFINSESDMARYQDIMLIANAIAKGLLEETSNNIVNVTVQ